MIRQLSLGLTDPERERDAAELWRRELRAAAEERGIKAVASDLDLPHSSLSQMLDAKDGHKLGLEETLAIMRGDRRGNVIAWLCAELGFKAPEALPEIDAGEVVARVHRWLSSLPPELAETIGRALGLR